MSEQKNKISKILNKDSLWNKLKFYITSIIAIFLLILLISITCLILLILIYIGNKHPTINTM
jgi:hypothetical protein